jgi:hypothetical protein
VILNCSPLPIVGNLGKLLIKKKGMTNKDLNQFKKRLISHIMASANKDFRYLWFEKRLIKDNGRSVLSKFGKKK